MSRRKFLCLDCGVDVGQIGELCFIDNSLWTMIHESPLGMLCIGCIEIRLGRSLVASDFTDCYLNRPNFGNKSVRLLDRLSSHI